MGRACKRAGRRWFQLLATSHALARVPPASLSLCPRVQDLWDDENVIAPLPLNVKKDNNPNSLKAKAAEIAAAMSLQ